MIMPNAPVIIRRYVRYAVFGLLLVGTLIKVFKSQALADNPAKDPECLASS